MAQFGQTLGMSKKPTNYLDVMKQKEEPKKFNLFDFSSTKTQQPIQTKQMNFGAPMSGKNITNFSDFKASIPQTPQQTQPTQKSGFSLIPTASADNGQNYIGELEYDIKNGATSDEIIKAYPEVKGNTQLVNELIFDIQNGATLDEVKQAYPELGQTQPIQTEQENLPGFDLGVKTSEGLANIGKLLKFEAGNELVNSKNPFVSSFGNMLEGFKFAGNIPGDTIQLAGDLGQAIANPIGTAKSLKTLAEATIETGLNKVFGTDVYTSEDKRKMIDGVSKALKDNFGTLEKAQKTIIENPTDVLLTIQGGLNTAKLGIKNPNTIAKIDKINEAISPINILKTEGKIAGKVVGGITKPITTPAKAIIQQGKTLFGKPDKIQGIQQAIKPYVKVKDGKVIRSNEQITNEIKRANELIEQSGDIPTDLSTYRQSLEKQLKGLGEQISAKTKQPLEVDLTETSSKLRELANKKTVGLLDKGESQKLTALADDLEKSGRIGVGEAEYMNQFINDTLRNIPNVSETYKRGLNILVKDLREKLDLTLSNIPGEFKQIKKDYGALRNILGDTVKREIVYNRQNPEGLITGISKMEGAGNVMSGLLKILGLDVKGGVADIGKGLIQNKIGTFIKTKNDPNYIIKQIFSNKGKNVNNANINIPSSTKNNIGITKNLGEVKQITPSILSTREKPLLKPNQPTNATLNKPTKEASKNGGEVLKPETKLEIDNKGIERDYNTGLATNKGFETIFKRDTESLQNFLDKNKNISDDKIKGLINQNNKYIEFHQNNIDNPIEGIDINFEKRSIKHYENLNKIINNKKDGIIKKILPSNFKEKAQDFVEKVAEKTGAKTNLLPTNSKQVSKVSDDLISEAKKYKSADEFIKGLKKEGFYFHGTNKNFINPDVNLVGKGEGSSMAGKGFNLTDNPQDAMNYAYQVADRKGGKQEVLGTYIDKNKLNLFDIDKLDTNNSLQDELVNYIIKNQKEYSINKKELNKYIEENWNGDFVGVIEEGYGFGKYVDDFIKNNKYDGVITNSRTSHMFGDLKNENITIFNPKDIKMVNLKQIYEQANKPKLIKAK